MHLTCTSPRSARRAIAGLIAALLLSSVQAGVGRFTPLRPATAQQAVLTSCAPGEAPLDGKPGQLSPFVAAFLEGLGGAGTNAFGELTLRELGDHVRRQVSAQTERRQNPVLSGPTELIEASLGSTGRKKAGEGGIAGRVVVLAIGVSDYDHGLPRLVSAARDAKAFAEGWSDRARHLKRPVATKSLTDGRATRARIVEELERVAREAKPNDLTVVFFSGLGMEQEGVSLLMPSDATLDLPELTSLRLDDLSRVLGKLPGPSWLVLDASTGPVRGTR